MGINIFGDVLLRLLKEPGMYLLPAKLKFISLLCAAFCIALNVPKAIGADGSMTILDEKSPDFYLGKATRRGLLIKIPDTNDMSISLGARFQGTVEAKEAGNAWAGDFYGRRIRFEVGANFSKHLFYFMDFRNDQANQGDSGEREWLSAMPIFK
jgi:hypothetical protein